TPRELFARPANAFIARFLGFDAILKPQRVESGVPDWHAQVAGRHIRCEPPASRAAANGYVLELRPERIRIARADEGSDLGPVKVTSPAYKGRDVEVKTQLVDGQSLKFLMSPDPEALVPESGSSIELVWQPMKPLLVPDTLVEP